MKIILVAGLISVSFLDYVEGKTFANSSWLALNPSSTICKDSMSSNYSEEKCRQGCSKPDGTCECFPGWRTAGPTDTLNWLKGYCSQSLCKTGPKCEEDLGFTTLGSKYYGEKAHCPVTGWNCKCSWKMAMMESFRGYYTDKAHCMNPMFLISFELASLVTSALSKLWMVFLFFFVICLPFGQNHVRCQHHNPDMFKMVHAILQLCGNSISDCDGQCSAVSHPKMWKYYYRFAWSLFVLDVFIWVYVTLCVALLTFEFIWAVALWLVVILILVVAALVAVVGACLACLGDGGGGGCEGDCLKCDGCCGGGDATCCECAGCCNTGVPGDIWMYNTTSSDIFFWGQHDECCRCECPKCTSCCIFLKPLAWLVHKIPTWPPNAWGGAVGYLVFQTHWERAARGLPTYEAGDRTTMWKRFIHRLGSLRWHNPSVYHEDAQWRQMVHRFLMTEPQPVPWQQRMQQFAHRPVHPSPLNLEGMEQVPVAASASGNRTAAGQHYQFVSGPRGRKIALIDTAEPFDPDKLFIAPSSYEDYKKGDCWICMSKEHKFHLWTHCGHIFGEGCSSEMIRRGMPCPLCREISPVVKIGEKYQYRPLNDEEAGHRDNVGSAAAGPRHGQGPSPAPVRRP